MSGPTRDTVSGRRAILLVIGCVLLGGCATAGAPEPADATSREGRAPDAQGGCDGARLLERDLSLNGQYEGVDQRYRRWDGATCTLTHHDAG